MRFRRRYVVLANALLIVAMLTMWVAPSAKALGIFWTKDNVAPSGTIGAANLDGTSPNQNFIPTADNPFGVAVDGNHVYWSKTDIPNSGYFH